MEGWSTIPVVVVIRKEQVLVSIEVHIRIIRRLGDIVLPVCLGAIDTSGFA